MILTEDIHLQAVVISLVRDQLIPVGIGPSDGIIGGYRLGCDVFPFLVGTGPALDEKRILLGAGSIVDSVMFPHKVYLSICVLFSRETCELPIGRNRGHRL